MKCPKCGNKVLQKSDTSVRLRVKGKIEFKDDVCKSQCYWCGETVSIYFPLGMDDPVIQERFIINRD